MSDTPFVIIISVDYVIQPPVNDAPKFKNQSLATIRRLQGMYNKIGIPDLCRLFLLILFGEMSLLPVY